ncbi:hypothetical protein [Actinomadura rupiterrae]|uniref:hypothetical protein n=1 Tax=Actinomadura rupiterrae TaxID=559627 RepID=UPI0020A4754E|nr:hypothetical protein [Actinomadura rupiterrae]MCP2337774.1 hypothetical protein [Actinomadura rupiterrae]
MTGLRSATEAGEAAGDDPASGLLVAWRRRSTTAGWGPPDDWWTPAVEDMASAARNTNLATRPCADLDARAHEDVLADACTRLGQARGAAGVGVGETLVDLGAFFDVLDGSEPPLELVRRTVEGWADAALAPLAAESCQDPLTGLMTVSYMRARLTELYAAADSDGRGPSETHCLVMLDLADGCEPWRRLARAIVVAYELRAVFRNGETPALIGSGRAAVLVPMSPHLARRLAVLHRRIVRVLGADVLAGRFLLWVERLPDAPAGALTLLDPPARAEPVSH